VINSLIWGGAETQVIALSRELASRGHQLAIYALRANNPREAELRGTGVRLVADQVRWKCDFRVIGRLRRFIRDFRADIVHGFLWDGNFYATVAAAGTGVPALVSERNDNYRLPLPHRVAVRATRRLARGLVANTFAGASFAQRLFDLPTDNVHVVWNGIALQANDCLPDRTSDGMGEFFGTDSVKTACVAAMMRPEKDLRLALLVAKALTEKDSRWRVLFVGDALPQTQGYKSSIMRLYDHLELGATVTFAGLRQDVRRLIQQSDVMLSTARHEGFPNVVLEAMAVGTPVVSTDYSDIRRILPQSWQVVGSRDPDDLADAIIRADRERHHISSSQRRWLESNATIAMAGRRLESVYQRYGKAPQSCLA
jgi:glycosyltransferase involved in cell wall biosynthesis